MTFERVFESRVDRVVMIGLFLALLELIRGRLVWAEQSASAIYLRALTDEPAEQAVQQAILTTEADSEESRVEHQGQPPIPIAELPARGTDPVEIETRQPKEQPAIPITELPAEGQPVASPHRQLEQ